MTQGMTRRFPVLVAGLLMSASVLLSVPSASAVDQLFVSVEVEDAPDSGCQADNVGSPGPELRTAADALNDAWHAAALAAGDTVFQEASLPPPGSRANPVSITFPFASGDRIATVTAVDVADPTPGSGDQGSPIAGNVTISTGPTLQECSPKPAHIFDSGGPHWTEGIGSGASRNGVQFTFDAPVRAFGAWFGDLETGPEAEGGVTALVKLFDSSGSEIGSSPVDTSTANTSDCGGPNSSDLPGCGNDSTRWIGFVRDAADVAVMLVIVGDDDTPASGGDLGGLSEHTSWTGAQMALAPAALEIDKAADVTEVSVTGSIEYSVTVTNTGDEPATGVTITDSPDPSLSVVAHDGGVPGAGQITWTIPTLAGGSTVAVSYTASVAVFDPTGYANVASVESDTTAVVEDSVLVAARYADLSITKAATNAPNAGETLAYELTVSNAGTSAATAVTVTDTPDASVISASGPGWTCDVGPPVICVLGSPLPVGETSSSLAVTVATPSGADTVVTNRASVSSDLHDPDEVDNTAVVAVNVTMTTTTTSTTTTVVPPSTTISAAPSSSTTAPAVSTTSTIVAGSLPETGLSGLPPAVGLALVGFGVALLLMASLWEAMAGGRSAETRDG